MNAMVFGLTYLYSWLLMGLGVFLVFRVVADLRRSASNKGPLQAKAMAANTVIRLSLVALVVLVSVGVTYAGAYAFYNLVVAG